MSQKIHPTYLEIDLRQFKKNIKIIRKIIKNRLFCLPVKANAYGFGIIEIGKAAIDAGVDYLGVSCLAEAIKLRKENIKIPILVLGAIQEDQIESLISYNIEFTIASRYKADLVLKFLKNSKKKAFIHIEVDTGMQRTGMKKETAIKLFNYLKNKKNIKIIGIYSHLATSNKPNDPFCLHQIKTFKNLVNKIDPKKTLISHIANSSAIEFYKNSFEDFKMVRPGILAYGYPLSYKLKKTIKPFLSLKSQISFSKVVDKNKGISYSHTYVTKNKTCIVTIPIGYGDGYKRCLSNIGKVLIGNKEFKISGNICMDQLMVDIGKNKAYVGDEVILIGKQGNREIKVEDLAKLCKTNVYEILCSFTSRILKVYVN